MSRPLPLIVSLVCVFALAPSTHARDPRLGIELALGISGSTELRTVVMTSPLLTLSAPVSADSGVVAQWGFGVASGEPTDASFESSHFAIGNPLIGWSIVFIEGLVFTPSLTLPVARAPAAESRRPASEFAFKGGLGLRGAVDPWLWRPDQLGIVLPFAYVTWLDPILVEAHFKLGFLTPTTGADADSDFVLQGKLRLAAHMTGGFWVAAAVTGVYTPTDTVDNFQGAFAPELRYVLGPGSHIELTLLMNIDTPYGPFSEPGKFWGIQVGGSAKL